MSALCCRLATPTVLRVFLLLGRGVSLHGWSIKVQPLQLTLDEVYLLTDTTPDLEHGVASLVPPEPMQPPLHGRVISVLIIH